ncbi:MAG TPA: phosphoribosyltransferase [Devosia sp.]|nr:phosphoribosyltransferase [Devosia sp.]
MSASGPLFDDRREAGRRLGEALRDPPLAAPIVFALPRGGVPVGYEVARALEAPLEILLVRKIGAPGQPEYALGAVADGAAPQIVLNPEAVALFRPDPAYIEAESRRQLAEIERRRRAYVGERPPLDCRSRTAVVVDDGIATGSTARAALMALRQAGAAATILAVPVAAGASLPELRKLADRVVCLATPSPFVAVGNHYARFDQTGDEEVVALLAAARTGQQSERRQG